MKKLILLFIDGIGLAPQSEYNPISGLFEKETDGWGLKEIDEALWKPQSLLLPVDATLGLKGEPQSATGQASLFTGINAPQLLGYHLPAFPNKPLVNIIGENSVMKMLAQRGISVTSANMYSHKFFEDRRGAERNRFPASTLTIEASGVPFRMAEEYRNGKAVFADITGEMLLKRGYDIDAVTAEEAGKRMLAILSETQFVFFEYFLTDHYGHKRNREALAQCVSLLNRFVSVISEGLEMEDEAILITSDHGNSEDMRTGGHTRNPVPGLLIGGDREARNLFSRCGDLTDIYRFMVQYFG